MTRFRAISIITAILAAIIVAGCPKVAPKPGVESGAVLLEYKFPQGRTLKYRSRTETSMRFMIPFITEPQQVRTETAVILVEEVIQAPLGGYALVEQRIEDFRVLLYQGNRLLYDSARPEEFTPQLQFEKLLTLKGLTVRYEIGTNGAIRRVEGLEEFSSYMGPGSISQVFQNAQPTFPKRPVAPGESWKSRRKVPFVPGKGFQGMLIINDNTRFVELRETEGSRQAVIELLRNLTLNIDVIDPKRRKNRTFIKGRGSSVSTVILDLERGIVIQGEGRISVSTSTVISDQPGIDQFTVDIEGTISNTLVE